MKTTKPYRYYSLDFSGPPGAEKYLCIFAEALKHARLCSIHDYGMYDGSLYRLVRSVRPLEEVKDIVLNRLVLKYKRRVLQYALPPLVTEVPPDHMTLRNRTVAQEFTKRRTRFS